MRLIAPDLDTVGRSINQGSPSPSPLQSESSDWMRAAAPFGRADYSVWPERCKINLWPGLANAGGPREMAKRGRSAHLAGRGTESI